MNQADHSTKSAYRLYWKIALIILSTIFAIGGAWELYASVQPTNLNANGTTLNLATGGNFAGIRMNGPDGQPVGYSSSASSNPLAELQPDDAKRGIVLECLAIIVQAFAAFL